MPEGPEITYFSAFLRKKLSKYKLVELKSYTDKPVILPGDDLWDGTILQVNSKGKLLWFEISGKSQSYYMHIHYGLTGWFTFYKPESNIKFELIFKNIENDKGLTLYMEDIRRFSKISLLNKKEHDKIIKKLGIDLFGENFTLDNFKKIIKSKNTMICALLLKQEIFCGIGNYIKNESLYLSNLNVKIKTSELNDTKISNLYSNILFVGYSNLIEMLSDSKISLKYLDPAKLINNPANSGKKLEIPYNYKIYRQDKTPDGKKVYKIKVAGRDTYCTKELC
jgi:formamidopyrimidine-DNA glycosylase